MEKSANYNFNLPNSANDEIADINDISDNFRIIDEKLAIDQTFSETSENPQSGTAIAEVLSGYVSAEVGKGLSSNDYTDEEKEKLAGIEDGAEVNAPVDTTYNPESANAQSGKAVAQVLNPIEIFEEYIKQYLNQSTITKTEVWNYTEVKGVFRSTGFSEDYAAYEPVFLKAGKYRTVNPIYDGQSFFKTISGTVNRFSAAFPTLSKDKFFNLAEDSVIYISFKYSQAPDGIGIYDYTSEPLEEVDISSYKIIASKNRSLISGLNSRVDELEKEAGVIQYDQLFIKNGELVCLNNKNASIVAKYAQIDLKSKTVKIMCRTKMKAGNVTLVSTALNEKFPIESITKGSIHIVFNNNYISAGVYKDRLSDLAYIYYTPMNFDGLSEYEFGFEFIGTNKIRVYAPNPLSSSTPFVSKNENAVIEVSGENLVDITYEEIDAVKGNYVVYEQYVKADTLETFDSPHTTGIYASAESTPSFRDNFLRPNGALNIAPTGHVYKLFSSADSTDTIYDSTNQTK